jgi:Glutathione peroxidase
MDKSSGDTFENPPTIFWDLEANDIDGNPVKFKSLEGKKAFLIVNVASKCGLTHSNYTFLTKLYDQYKYMIFHYILT